MTKELYNKNEETSYSTKMTLLQKSNYYNNKHSIKWKQDEVWLHVKFQPDMSNAPKVLKVGGILSYTGLVI